MELITQRLKISDTVDKKLITALKKEYDIAPDAEIIRKGIVPDDLKFDEGERSVIAYITTNTKDRDNEVVDPSGCIMTDYLKNRVVLFGHDHRGMPIGKCAWIKSDEKGLIAKTIYANTAQANEIYEYRKAGFPMAQSIGFIPLETMQYQEGSPEYAQGIRLKYTKWLLLEYSDVPVPSNPEALTIAVSKGLLTMEDAPEYTIVLADETKAEETFDHQHIEPPEDDEIIETKLIAELSDEDKELVLSFIDDIKTTKPGWDKTDDMIRYRVRNPALFVDGTFKTVPIKKDKPRINSVMGKLKSKPDVMTVQNLMFPIEDDWTEAKAKEWVSSHQDLLKNYDELYELKTIYEEVYEDAIKSGRVLSSKNRGIIDNAVKAMGAATSALTELLSATEPSEPTEEGKSTGSPEGYEVNIEPETKNVQLAPTVDDVKAIVNTCIAQMFTEKIMPAIRDVAKDVIKRKQGKLN